MVHYLNICHPFPITHTNGHKHLLEGENTIGPLTGYKIIEFSPYPVGSILGMLLSDQGAEVTRINSTSDCEPRMESSANSVWNRGKKFLNVDIKAKAGMDHLLHLIGISDVVIYDRHSDHYDGFDLSYQSFSRRHPGLVCVSLPGFPKGHMHEDLPPDEGIIAAASGIYSLNPSGGIPIPGEGPSFHGLPYAGTFAAITASAAVVAALYQREKHGEGQQIIIPVHDAMYQGMGTALVRHSKRTHGNQERHPVIKRFYQCKDGRWININISLPRFLKPFLETIDHIEWLEPFTDTKSLLSNQASLCKWIRRFSEVWLSKTALEWEDTMAKLGIPGTLCRTIDEWLESKHSVISGATIVVDDPVFGRMKQPGKIIRFNNHNNETQ